MKEKWENMKLDGLYKQTTSNNNNNNNNNNDNQLYMFSLL